MSEDANHCILDNTKITSNY